MFKRYTYVEGLTSLNNNEEGVLINIHGQIKDKFGNDLPMTYDAQGHKVVNVQSWDGKRDYRVIDLVALQFKSLMIPKNKFDRVIAFVIDSNKENTHAENIGYRFEDGKLEVEDQPGFYYVPGFTAFAINIDGCLYSIKNNRIKRWYITKPDIKKNIKGGYFVNNGWFASGMYSNITRHRSKCLVFKEYPDNVDSLIVNHKNGIPGEDDLENLEWATRGENNIHAYVNGLKEQNKQVLVRDVLSGEIIEYYSISECARALGYRTDETIRARLYNSNFGTVFGDGKQVKLKSDTRDWIIPSDPEAAVFNARQKIPIAVRNCKTLEETWYESVMVASTAIGVNRSTIFWNLNNNRLEPCFGYQFKYLDDPTPFADFTEDMLSLSLLPSSISVDCKNHLTGETISFNSVNLACQYVSNTNAAVVLRRGEQPLYPNGWQLKLSNQQWQEYENFEAEIYSRTKDITAKEESTGKIIIAESARKMAEILKLDSKALRLAALTRGNKIYHGYRFRLGVDTEPWPTTILP